MFFPLADERVQHNLYLYPLNYLKRSTRSIGLSRTAGSEKELHNEILIPMLRTWERGGSTNLIMYGLQNDRCSH